MCVFGIKKMKRVSKIQMGFKNDSLLWFPFSVHAIGMFEGTVFFDKELEFRLGFDEANDLPRGVEEALRFFSIGSRGSFDLTPEYAFGSLGRADLGIPRNASVTYDVTLISCEPVSSSLFCDNIAN